MDEQAVAQLWTENAALRVENQALRAHVGTLEAQVATLQEQMSAATARVGELEQGGQRRRRFGKPASKGRPAPPTARRMRAPEQNAGRPLDPPTAFVRHAYEACPDCGSGLRDGSVWWRRQVVDLPPPAPLVVTEHTFMRRWCPACRTWCVPPRPAGLSLGQGRLGVGIASLVATLRTTLRLPIAQIQGYLAALHGLRLSTGGIVDLLRRVAQASAPTVAGFQAQARGSPLLHGDETGWRENGQHGYVWLLTTPGPAPVCYVERDRSRAHTVLDRLLGDQFRGVLVSDFYGAYNSYAGKHQRCWAHLLRDLHDLKEEHPDRPAVLAWARAVRRLYDWATAFLQTTDPPSAAQRQRAYDRLVAVSHRLGLRYAQAKRHPCQALAKRLLRHEAELFPFVLIPGLSPDNNLAERRIRPLAVTRKISGGTRSPEGSAVRMTLTSLFGTWQARNLNPFTACRALLSQP